MSVIGCVKGEEKTLREVTWIDRRRGVGLSMLLSFHWLTVVCKAS
ncbi:hypothetical protein [Microcoleus sp. F4-D5]